MTILDVLPVALAGAAAYLAVRRHRRPRLAVIPVRSQRKARR